MINEYYRKLRVIRKGFDWDSYVYEHFDVKNAVGAERRVCCPFCGERKHKMYVNIDKRYFICFKCQTSSRNADVFDFIAANEGLNRNQAIMQCLTNYTEVCPTAEEIEEALREAAEVKEAEENSTIKTIESLPSYASPLSKHPNDTAFRYLLDRGVTKQEILDMQTHFIPKGEYPLEVGGKYYGNMANRVLWPIYGGSNQLVSWIARTIDPNVKDRKYINCPKSELAKTVWPYVPPRGSEVVLVEGILDCLAVRRLGFDCYATFGKAVSKDQRELLQEWKVSEVILCYDKDAKNDTLRTAEALKIHFSIYVPEGFLTGDADPGDTLNNEELKDELSEVLNNSISVDSSMFLKWRMWA